MAYKKEDDTELDVAGFKALFTADAAPTQMYTATENIYQEVDVDGGGSTQTTQLKFNKGAKIPASVYNSPYDPDDNNNQDTEPVFTSVTPTNPAVAGGTVLTIKGEHLLEVDSLTIAGNAGTSLTKKGEKTLTVVAPAHAAGAGDIVFTFAGGTITATAAVTYA